MQPVHSARRIRFVSALAFLMATAGVLRLGVSESADMRPIPLKVRFWADEIELTGAVPDQDTANRLNIATHQAYPEKPIWDRLIVDPGRTVIDLPSGQELAGLLLELALSTRDGSLQVTGNDIVVSGLTDSLVTHAAFDARLRPLAARYGGRHLRNRICLVHEDDLATDLLPIRPRPVLSPRPLRTSPVELAEAEYGPPMAPLRAKPLAMAEVSDAPFVAVPVSPADSENHTEAEKTQTPAPKPAPSLGFETIEKIEFTANSYLVGFKQSKHLDSAIALIKKRPIPSGKIILRGYPDSAGKHIYNDWLCRARSAAVQRTLVAAGIPADRLALEIHAGTNEASHLRSVRILVPRLPAPEPDPLLVPTEDSPEIPISAEVAPSQTISASRPDDDGTSVFSSPPTTTNEVRQ